MLWLFPGSIPHCVLPFGETEVEGRAEDPQHAVRVSVAINLHHAVPASDARVRAVARRKDTHRGSDDALQVAKRLYFLLALLRREVIYR